MLLIWKRLYALILAAVARVVFLFLLGWVGERYDTLRGACKFKSGPHLIVYKLDAYVVRIEDTRRAALVGFWFRRLSHFFTRVPVFITPSSEVLPDETA